MSLKIGKYIKFALNRDTLEGKVFPVVAHPVESPSYPHVTYASNGITVGGTKDGDEDELEVELMVKAKTYEEMMDVAQEVRELMEDAQEEWNDDEDSAFQVTEQEFRSGSEDYDLVGDYYYVPILYQLSTCGNCE